MDIFERFRSYDQVDVRPGDVWDLGEGRLAWVRVAGQLSQVKCVDSDGREFWVSRSRFARICGDYKLVSRGQFGSGL